VGVRDILRSMFRDYPSRSALGLGLMISQAFFYNAIFFTYGLVLTHFYGVPDSAVPAYIVPFAIGNFLGPIVLGPLFDLVGRRKMIAVTYAGSGILLAVTGLLFVQGLLTAVSQTILWSIVFFIASPAASSAYLTVSEIFPLEVRPMAIAVFYSIGTGTGGVLAPWLFASLIATGSRDAVFAAYLVGVALMIGAAILAWFLGVDAERIGLEAIAKPLSAASDEEGEAPS
jgi:MFS family permease